jgi:thiamine-monophosphate kinase
VTGVAGRMTPKDHPNRPGEFAMIAQIFAPLSGSAPGAFGLSDDAASCTLPTGHDMVVTTDVLVEGVHFLRDDLAELIARKSLRVNLSDLAAKGADTVGYLLTLSLPDWVDTGWLEGFANGLRVDQDEFGIALLGGDTTSTPGPLTIGITALGSVRRGGMLRRAGAEVGDRVFVTGTIGDAGGGLEILQGSEDSLSEADRDFLVSRYLLPQPRLGFGTLLKGLATASLDVSDGLIADLGHISDVSGVRIVVEASNIPLSPALAALWGNGTGTAARAASAGDDYEIAFTAPESLLQTLNAASQESGVVFTEIGRVEEGSGVSLLDPDGNAVAVDKPGFTHF